MKYLTTINDKTFEIDIQGDGTLLVNGEKREVDFRALGPAFYSIIMQNLSYELVIEEREGNEVEVFMRGRMYNAQVMDERAQLMAARAALLMADTGDVSVKAPMPGLVVAVPVEAGQAVKAGQTVVILESMKMQNELKAPRDGTVQAVHVTAGQSVEQNKVLVTIA
jgi:biotin carboxyl carrier protein